MEFFPSCLKDEIKVFEKYDLGQYNEVATDHLAWAQT